MSRDLLTVADFEEVAKTQLPKTIYDYICGGAMYEETIAENLAAFKRYKIRPRLMRDVSVRNLETTILGNKVAMPIGISPTALHNIVHSQGEIATAKGAIQLPTVMVAPMLSSVATKEMIEACPSLIGFQQLFITKPKKYTIDLVRRAEINNIKALVVTLDQTVFPIKLRDRRNNTDLSKVTRIADPVLGKIYKENRSELYDILFHASTTWDDIVWLKSITTLPVIVKGILNKDDAADALKCGVDAIWVSNHGGRQLDSAQATMDVLFEIVQLVDGKCEIYVDGGFRTGIDVFKALALGARAVFIGRPIVYGVACDGENGVKKVLNLLKNELDNTMALAGCKELSDINPSHLTKSCNCKL